MIIQDRMVVRTTRSAWGTTYGQTTDGKLCFVAGGKWALAPLPIPRWLMAWAKETEE